MLKRVPKMCITCQHYEPYHCTLDDSYIGYIYADKRTNCKAYSLSEHYRKGGKFYESRKEQTEKAPTVDVTGQQYGRWAEDSDPGQAYGSTWKCSNCGYSYHEQVPWKPEEAQWYYCPHCGSKNGGDE